MCYVTLFMREAPRLLLVSGASLASICVELARLLVPNAQAQSTVLLKWDWSERGDLKMLNLLWVV